MFYLNTNIIIFLLLKYYENNVSYNNLLYTQAECVQLTFWIYVYMNMWQAERYVDGCAVWNHRTTGLRPHGQNAESV